MLWKTISNISTRASKHRSNKEEHWHAAELRTPQPHSLTPGRWSLMTCSTQQSLTHPTREPYHQHEPRRLDSINNQHPIAWTKPWPWPPSQCRGSSPSYENCRPQTFPWVFAEYKWFEMKRRKRARTTCVKTMWIASKTFVNSVDQRMATSAMKDPEAQARPTL